MYCSLGNKTLILFPMCHLENSRQVEAEPDIAFPEIICSAGKEGFFVHTGTVAKV